ncbi:MAG: 3-deoxy-7-phosphoheptulonate synthase [Chloroflexi bacterium]|nr:3-deoxy-7-phosphoheptulonate synthase [Chloroflexota bacterium]MDA1218673.1 3-deoxy-7-phosphoheptulonate synthase [Chloroflexota bacterium]
MQPSATRDVHILDTQPLITPIDLVNKLPITPEVEQVVLSGREQVRNILNGEDPRLLVIVGPCSIHSEELALEYARQLKDLADKLSDRLMIVMRVYFEKPRTTVGWKGLIYDPHLNDTFDIESGLRTARSLLLKIGEMGMYAGTEFLDPVIPQYLAGLITWSTIGARTTESQIHRQMASGLSMPVGFKNGTDGNAQIAVDAMLSARSPHGFLGLDHQGRTALVRTTGNPDGHLVLRGGNQGPNFGSESIAEAKARLEKAGVRSQMMVDCSHGNSNKDHKQQGAAFKDVVAQKAAGEKDIIGLMLESNLNEGNQKMCENPADLQYGVSITDACIGWDETEVLLKWAYDAVADTVNVPVS